MLSQHKTKPHKVRWTEAERELAIRGVFLPPQTVIHDYFSIPKDSYVPHIKEEPDPKEAVP